MSQEDRTADDIGTAPVAGRRATVWPGGLWREGGLRQLLAATLARELDAGRGFLWLTVAFACGILVYFSLPVEPWLPALIALAVGLGAAAIAMRDRPVVYRVIAIGLVVALGVVAAKVRTDVVASPVLTRQMTAEVTGWIARAEQSASGGRRVYLRVAAMEDIAPAATPVHVRVTVRTGAQDLSVGDDITVLANVGPPPGPVMPGGYDFSFFPFYERIGAVGFAYGAARPAELGSAPWTVRLRAPLEHLRNDIRMRIEAALPGDYGRIAAALVMGDQRGISAETHEAMRASGLGHILSISGLHMVLVAGSAFVLLRALFALWPALALTHPIKKWAAGGALAIATFYLGISGAEVATVRSYVMLAIMLCAVMLDRRALTLRNVALAALVILAFSPESLLSISFQMSFAATIALIATYEALSARAERRASLADAGDGGWHRRFGMMVATLFLTALVAGLATAPFGAYYFQRVAPLTIVANMAVAPVISIIVMPFALIAVILLPLGLEAWPLTVMAWGLKWMVAVAHTTAAWSEGWGGTRAMPGVSLLLIAAGLLWIALWRERWRWLGIAPVLVALPVAWAAPQPALLVDENATAVAIRSADGQLRILGGRGADFEIETWLRADGDQRMPGDPALADGTACEPLGCIGAAAGLGKVAFVARREAYIEDCQLAAVIISALQAPPGCAAHAMVIDRDGLDRRGAHAIYVKDGVVEVVTAYPAVRRPFMPPTAR